MNLILSQLLIDVQNPLVLEKVIEEQRRIIHIQKCVYFIAIVIIVLLIITIGFVLVRMELLREKNKLLVEQINDSVKKPKKAQILEGAPSEAVEKYLEISRKIKDEELFLDPNFGRREMSLLATTNETYLYNIFKEAAGTTLSSYITDLRLEYCIDQMKNKGKKISIEELAIMSGFNNVRTLQRLFKTKYGLSPKQFIENQTI